ncbi:MAG TPA: CDP-alcohol phosphatidyltransferase family protein [Streptosporangiaceae bacterium]|jgi:CDP-diacylglycerol--glycerol-3-phosphate 3-phosphatidyltransferase
MLNGARPFFTRLMTPVGEALARTPITPNMVTVTGTVGLSASVLWGYPTGHLFLGTIVATFFVFTDMLDGVLARIKGTSGKFGAFLDSTMDRVADAAVFSGLAIWFVLGGHSRLMAAVSLFCLVSGALVSYVKARAEGLGTTANVGIAERPERMVLTFVVTGLWGLGVPYILPAGLWVLAVASVITLFQRIHAVHKGLAGKPPPIDGEAADENQTGSATAAHTIE